MSSSGPSPSLDRVRDAFRGCMIGAVLGDCLGAPLEFISDRPLPLNKVTKQFEIYKSPDDKTYEYTDDTAMARQLAIVLAKRHQKSEGSSGLDSRALAEA